MKLHEIQRTVTLLSSKTISCQRNCRDHIAVENPIDTHMVCKLTGQIADKPTRVAIIYCKF